MDKETFDKKLKDKYDNERYTVLYYGKNNSENSVIKCLECGRRIEVNTGELFRTRRKHICSKCNYKRKDTKKNEQIIVDRLASHGHQSISFFMKERNGIRHNVVHFECGRCGKINEKEVANFLRQKYDCGFCEGAKESKDTDIFVSELKELFGESLSLISEYVNAETNITIRCNKCGFIRKVKPTAILRSGYCPKCGKEKSKGERKIKEFLEKQNIAFQKQKFFSEWNIGIHYFDFYIPEFNLLLEYHGVQHYEFIPYFFKNEEAYLYYLNKDKIKKETAIARGYNYVSIKYDIGDIKQILSLLFNSTTIPKGSRGKCLEIETIQDIG